MAIAREGIQKKDIDDGNGGVDFYPTIDTGKSAIQQAPEEAIFSF